MRLSKLLITLSIIPFMVSCGLDQEVGHEVSREKYTEKANKVKFHHFSKLTMTWTHEEHYIDRDEHYSGTTYYEYVDDLWTNRSGDSETLYFPTLPNAMASYYATYESPSGNKIIKFYITPLKVVIMSNPDKTDLAQSEKTTYIFSEYGLITEYHYKVTIFDETDEREFVSDATFVYE